MIYLAAINVIFILTVIFLIRQLIRYSASQKTLYRLMNHTNIGYYKYRQRDGMIINANKGFADIIELGLTRKELVGRSLNELFISVDGEENLREKMKGARSLRNYEHHFKTLKGKDKWMLHNSYIVKDPATGEELIEAWVEDITEEILSYEKMKKSQQRYEKLFKNSGDMVIIYRFGDGNIVDVNPQTEDITGYSKEELVDKPFKKLFHPLYRNILDACHKDLLFGGSSRIESVIVRKNGLYREISLTMSISQDEGDKMVIAIARDISLLVKEREEQDRRKKELEKFWKAAIEREDRIKGLRAELQVAKQQIELLKGKKSDTGKKNI